MPLTDVQKARLIAERAAQGLPPKVEDKATLERVATIAAHAEANRNKTGRVAS